MTTAEYIEHFELAIADGKKQLQISSFSIPWDVSKKLFVNSSGIVGLSAIVFEGNPNLAQIIAESTFGYRCYYSAMMLRPIVDTFIGKKSFLTLGYINFRENEQFNFKKDILDWAKHPDLEKRKCSDLHAWITSPSGEIIDYALAFAIINFMRENNEGTEVERAMLVDSPFIGTVEHLDIKRNIKYYPLGVGEEFAFKIGLETMPK